MLPEKACPREGGDGNRFSEEKYDEAKARMLERFNEKRKHPSANRRNILAPIDKGTGTESSGAPKYENAAESD